MEDLTHVLEKETVTGTLFPPLAATVSKARHAHEIQAGIGGSSNQPYHVDDKVAPVRIVHAADYIHMRRQARNDNQF